MKLANGQLKRLTRKLQRAQTMMRKFNFECGPLQGRTKRGLFKWLRAFNKPTRRLIK